MNKKWLIISVILGFLIGYFTLYFLYNEQNKPKTQEDLFNVYYTDCIKIDNIYSYCIKTICEKGTSYCQSSNVSIRNDLIK